MTRKSLFFSPSRGMLFSVTEVTFNPICSADLPRLQQMARIIWRSCYREMLVPEQIEYMLGWMYSAESLDDDLRQGVVYQWISVRGKDVGYFAFEESPLARCLRLNKLYLLPEHQSQGLGQAALLHVSALACSAGLDAVELHVNKRNLRAIRAYERAGFSAVASMVKDIGHGFVMDDYVMCKPCRVQSSDAVH